MKLLLILILSILAGCTVYKDAIDEAEELCAQNGGLVSIATYKGIVRCVNGATFYP